MLRFNGVTRAVATAVLKTKAQSPHIFFGVGLASVVTGGVLACRATLKLEGELDTIKSNLDMLAEASEKNLKPETMPANMEPSVYYQQMRVKVYIQGGVRLVKLYGPAVLVTGVGVAMLTGSHVQLTKRNAALQAALVAVQGAFNDYRERMKQELGDAKEEAIFRNLDGLGKNELPDGRNPNKFSPYARIFDGSNPNWYNDPELNRSHIQLQENYANHKLHARGHVFLNEVYDALGFEHTREGSIMGWVLNSDGAGYIDFGMLEIRNAEFIQGRENTLWLDFNVDGVIYDKI